MATDRDWIPFISFKGGDRAPGGSMGAYWIGSDGNVWVKGSQGTNSAGRADGNTHSYWQQRGYNLVQNPGGGSSGGSGVGTGGSTLGSSTAYSGGGGYGGGGAPAPVLNTAAINNTQLALDQLPGLLQAALEGETTRYGNTMRGFDDQEAGQRKQYDESTVTNQQNYDANYMDAIRAGIKGLGGLFNLLRGTGVSGGGTAEDLARDAVGGVTATDIRTGADTQKANQTSLDSTLSNFLTQLKGKRQSTSDTFENNKRAIHRDNATQMQDLYGKMAGYYSEGGRTAEAQNYMARAGGLTPQIAQNSMAKQSAYDTTPVAVAAPKLTAFAEPTQPNTVLAPEGDQIGSGLFTMERKKSQEEIPVPLAVGV